MSRRQVARYRRPVAGAASSRAIAQEWRWAAFLVAGVAGLWFSSPGFLTSGLLAFLFSLGLLISAMRRVAVLETGIRGGSEPGFIDQLFAGGLMASLLWSALLTTVWVSAHIVPQGTAGPVSLGIAGLVAFMIFCCLVVGEGVVSYVLLRAVGAGRTDMAADVAFALHVETKFGGMAGRLRH